MDQSLACYRNLLADGLQMKPRDLADQMQYDGFKRETFTLPGRGGASKGA